MFRQALLRVVCLLVLPLAAHTQELIFIDGFEDGATITGRLLDTNAYVADGSMVPVVGAVVSF